MKQSILKDMSKVFALRIFKLYNYLGTTKHEYVMAKQLLRSGTSIGTNIAEAFYGQSDADFISKLSLSQKKCAETLYWLDLLHESNMIEEAPFQSIYTDATELMKLLTSSIKTKKAKHLTLKPNT